MSTEGKVITCKAAVAWEAGKPLCKYLVIVQKFDFTSIDFYIVVQITLRKF